MPILATLLLTASSPLPPPCQAGQLRLSLDAGDGDFNGMSHAGTGLSVRNMGQDCLLATLPRIQMRDARNRILPVVRQAPRGMHPGPAMVPLRLAAGHRAVAEIRWVAGPVFPRSRSVHVARITLTIGAGAISSPLTAEVFGAVGQPATFEQTPLRAVEGMAAG
ncbi:MULTISPECIES: DUF4232 domain-containing protein [unclassified Sphingomonas]|uniref:DUF4232 domain-containing protein n=1 Tax=unclassified Sphingomonas TaxID=196159 RepID=UPI0006F5BF7B|nr:MULTISPECIES: DUF4232 domain-containing protein [unclassified Sphingomonas]KQM23928.1 hypothetical protein ASE58_16730 [Sphingomonas sp. Leaf9]